MLAVTLGHLESARTLLQHATNVNTENREGWTGIHSCLCLENTNFNVYFEYIILVFGIET